LGKWIGKWNEVDFEEEPLFAWSKAMAPFVRISSYPYPPPHTYSSKHCQSGHHSTPLSVFFYLCVADKDLPVLATKGKVWVEPTTTMGALAWVLPYVLYEAGSKTNRLQQWLTIEVQLSHSIFT
jgi:hypothetical protein